MIGFFEIVDYLLSLGAMVNAVDEDGRTALMHAANYRHYKVVSLLILAGANPEMVDKVGRLAAV